MTSRREFLGTMAAVLAQSSPSGPLSLRERGNGRVPIGFSTLGCPNWTWPQILDYAAAHGYSAVELRGLLAHMDLTQAPEFGAERVGEAKRQVAARGLVITCLSASANMHELDAAKRTLQLDEGRRFIDLAHALGAPYIRVFGNNYVAGVPRAEMLAHIAGGLRTLGDYARPRNVTVLIESHGDFTDSPALFALLTQAASPNVGLLWDAHHTFVSGKEEPEDTVRQLGRYIRHVHLKDSIPGGDGRRYVLTGTGEVPVKRQIEALVKIGYGGNYNFEWEKRWHPEIEEPEVAFAQYASVASTYLRDARMVNDH